MFSIIYNNTNYILNNLPSGQFVRAYSVYQLIEWLRTEQVIQEIVFVDELINSFSQAFKLLNWISGEMSDNPNFKLPKITLINADKETIALLKKLNSGKIVKESFAEEPEEDKDSFDDLDK